MVETTASDRMPTKSETPYFHAVVAALSVILFFFLLSLQLVGLFSEVLFLTLFFSPVSLVVAVAVLAWYGGCRVTVLPAALFLLIVSVLIFKPSAPISFGLYTSIPLVPVYVAVFVIGYEWMFRVRDRIFEFLSTAPGILSAVLGVVHVVAGITVQFRARPRRMDSLLYTSVSETTHILTPYMNRLGILLVVLALFVVVVLPAFLWYNNGMLAPIAVVTGWVTLGAWINYLWWNAYPIHPINALGNPPFFTDYAMLVGILLLLILLTAVLEGYVRNRRN